MASTGSVRPIGKWKTINLQRSKIGTGDFNDLISFEECSQYEIINNNRKSSPKKLIKKDQETTKKSKKKQAKKRKEDNVQMGRTKLGSNANENSNQVECDPAELEEDQSSKPPKMKIKKKKKIKTGNKNDRIKSPNRIEQQIESIQCEDEVEEDRQQPGDVSAWKDLFVPPLVLQALSDQGFKEPTPIQTLTLPSAIRDRKDIIGAAQTGSGKTLAFGIPLLSHIMAMKSKNKVSNASDEMDSEGSINSEDNMESEDDMDSEDNMESEEQNDDEVSDEEDLSGIDWSHLAPSDEDVESDDGEFDLPPDEDQCEEYEEEEATGCVYAENNVTFEWLEKESEKRKVNEDEFKPLYALILTPTRELAIQIKEHIDNAAKYTEIKSAVVVGGMAQQKQERLLKKCPEIIIATPGRLWEMIQQGNEHLCKVGDVKLLVIDEADRMVEKGHFQELSSLLALINSDMEKKKRRQTFVFSATLTLIHGGPDRIQLNKKKKFKMTEERKLGSLIEEIGLKEKPKIIDLSNKGATADKLTEARINCSAVEKDLYVYYFLKSYPGRTLLFTNSKDCLRRVSNIFSLLQCCPLPLHADMHQRQRLKNLDRFKGNPRGFLLATDVAARGLDIPNVQHVIHYQVPRTTENYVHRSGRTARAQQDGLSVMMVAPEDVKNYRKIIKTLNREEDLPVFPVEQEYIPSLKSRLSLAHEIDKLEHRQTKKKAQNNWFQRAAKEMDIELDERISLHDMGDSFEQARSREKLAALRAQLKSSLSQPLLAGRTSTKYPTKSGRLIVPYSTGTSGKTAVDCMKQDAPVISEKKGPSLKRKRKQKNKFKKKLKTANE